MNELQGERVVIVGAGSGIGRSIAEAAWKSGASVVLAGRRREPLEQTAALAKGPFEIHQLNASAEEDVERFYGEVGSFDHLVSTAGAGVAGAITALRVADIQRAMEAKLWAPILLVKHGATRISPNGSFTFFSGIRGARPTSRSSITSLVNGGLEAFARAMAVELGPVRVNVISPGVVDSGAFWERMPAADRQQMFDDFALRAPARRIGQPEEQANAALFAMANSFLTGTVLAVDGGALLM